MNPPTVSYEIRMYRILFFSLIIMLVCSGVLNGQWRGPRRDGHFPGKGLLKEWPEDGPDQVYEVSGIGEGFSSPVVHYGNV
jgi:hypothetical protein